MREPFFRTRHRAFRRTRSGGDNDTFHFKSDNIIKKEWMWGRFVVWSKVVATETVPEWAAIQQACLGSTDWESALLKDWDEVLEYENDHKERRTQCRHSDL